MDPKAYLARELETRGFTFTPSASPFPCFRIDSPEGRITISGWEAFKRTQYRRFLCDEPAPIDIRFQLTDAEITVRDSTFQSVVILNSTVMYSPHDGTEIMSTHNCWQVLAEESFLNIYCPRAPYRQKSGDLVPLTPRGMRMVLSPTPTPKVLEKMIKDIDFILQS